MLVDLILEAQGRGKTVVTSTNDLHVVPEIAGRILVLGEDRRVLASGPPDEILAELRRVESNLSQSLPIGAAGE